MPTYTKASAADLVAALSAMDDKVTAIVAVLDGVPSEDPHCRTCQCFATPRQRARSDAMLLSASLDVMTARFRKLRSEGLDAEQAEEIRSLLTARTTRLLNEVFRSPNYRD